MNEKTTSFRPLRTWMRIACALILAAFLLAAVPAARTEVALAAKAKPEKTNPVWTASAFPNGITLDLKGFPTKRNYIVRVSDNGWQTSKWYKVGKIKTSKNGTAKFHFRIPKEYKYHRVVTVCLKDVMSDEVSCQQVWLTADFWSWAR